VETDRLLPPWDFDPETYQHYASATARFTGGDEDKPPPLPDPVTTPESDRVTPDDDSTWHRLHNSFAAAVTSFDAELEVLIEVLRERSLDQTAAWVLTSGYGWPLGEHGAIGPAGSRMHTELVHLPLVVRLPKADQAMRRVSTFTQSPDLAPTLHDLFGLRTTASSLLPLATGSMQTGRPVVRSASIRQTHTERAIRTPEWTFLPAVPEAGEAPRLYRKPDDVWEVNDLAPRHPDECDRLAALLDPKEPTP
jgi:arylsulfatase A-like enzyme